MSYTTAAELVSRYGEVELIQLSDRGGSGLLDDTVIAQAIGDADAEIDRFLAGRYAVPLVPVPDVIARAAQELARYFLFAAAGAVPDIVKDRYAATVRWLELVGKGSLALGIEPAAPPTGGDAVEMTSSAPLWDRADGSLI